MAITVVFMHDRLGDALTLRLSSAAGVMVNGSVQDEFSEPDQTGKPYRYEASVAENLSGQRLTAQVYDGSGVLYTGQVLMAADGQSCTIDDLALRGDLDNITVGSEVDSFSSDALAQLTSLNQINISIPTLNGTDLSIPLVAGDAYLHSLDRAIEFSRSDFPDITDDATAQLSAKLVDDPTVTFSISGSEASIPVTTGTKVVRFEPTSTQTAAWQPGRYEFDVQVTFSGGSVATFVGPKVYLLVVAAVEA